MMETIKAILIGASFLSVAIVIVGALVHLMVFLGPIWVFVSFIAGLFILVSYAIGAHYLVYRDRIKNGYIGL